MNYVKTLSDIKDLFTPERIEQLKKGFIQLKTFYDDKVKNNEFVKDWESFRQKIEEQYGMSLEELASEAGIVIDSTTATIVNTIDAGSERLKNNTPLLCEMIEIEFLELGGLKNIIKEIMPQDATYAAILNTKGNPKEDKTDVFLQFFNKETLPIDEFKIYCIRCKLLGENITREFGDKEMIKATL